MDQVAAETVGLETRFPHLGLSVKNGDHYADSISISRSGVSIPSGASAERLYRRLFIADTPEEKAATMRRIEVGGSVPRSAA